jgi:hypothetical protein
MGHFVGKISSVLKKWRIIVPQKHRVDRKNIVGTAEILSGPEKYDVVPAGWGVERKKWEKIRDGRKGYKG